MLTDGLDHKREDVAKDKDLGQPVDSNDGELLSLQNPNNSAQYHINRRSEQGRG